MSAVSLAEAARLVGEPALRSFGEGWDFRIFRAGNRVYRFPRRAESARRLAPEARILPLLAPVLPLEVPSLQTPPSRGPWRTRFACYRLMRGVPASRAPRLDPTLPRVLGAFLGALHAFPREAATAAGVRDGSATWEPVLYRAFVGKIWAAAPPPLPAPLARKVEDLLSGRSPAPSAAPGPLRLIHGDLEAEHVLVMRGSGRAVGVVDWGDVTLADPARDFAALWAWGGRAFLEAMLEAYPLPVDEGFRARVAFLGRVSAIDDLADAMGETRTDRVIAAAQLARAFDPAEAPEATGLTPSPRGSGAPGT